MQADNKTKANNIITVRRYSSPCGMLVMGSYGGRLCMCDWEAGRRHANTENRLRRLLNATFKEGSSPVIETATSQLDEYFAGERHNFTVPLLFAGTAFQQKVWNELPCIHYGHTMSYGEMAAKMGMPDAVRAVANANGANPISIIVPCHRVIGSNKSLTGYGGGLAAKEYLLQLERGNIKPGLFHQYFFV